MVPPFDIAIGRSGKPPLVPCQHKFFKIVTHDKTLLLFF
jgi:hypothetical protein